jgi:hypothetical protein
MLHDCHSSSKHNNSIISDTIKVEGGGHAPHEAIGGRAQHCRLAATIMLNYSRNIANVGLEDHEMHETFGKRAQH